MAAPVKVTFCIYDKPDNVGGPVSWVQRLFPALREHGIEARCLSLMHWGETGPAVSTLQSQGFDCKATGAYSNTEDRVKWILARLVEDPPDVFVPNLVVAGYFAARWVREWGIQTIGVLHSDDEFYRGLQDEFVFGPEQFRLTAIVCVSREIERQVLTRAPLGTIVRRIPYGVPVPRASVQRVRGRLRLAFLGRLAEEQKRISEVTRALIRAAREVPGTEADIYGDGPDRAAVERILTAEGDNRSVRLAGLLQGSEIERALLDCDVIVLLSDYEGLPIALLEAMACGCVPVCLRIRSGVPELIEDGVTGLIVDDRGESFVGAIRTLRDDPALWRRLSEGARSRVAASFADYHSAAMWAGLIREVTPTSALKVRPRMPGRLPLPRVHPGLASADVRNHAPPLTQRLYRRARIIAGRLKRRLHPGGNR